MVLKKLFGSLFGGSSQGGGKADEANATPEEVMADSESYNGFLIEAAPLKESGQFRTAGYISKEVDGEMRRSRFIRADNSTDQAQAASHSLAKGRQIIDEQGDRLLDREMV